MLKKSFQKLLNKLNVLLSQVESNHLSTYGLGRAIRNLRKELILYNNDWHGRQSWIKDENKFSTDKVQIGGGSHLLSSFLNIDIVPPADLLCDVREGIPLSDHSCNFIFTEHFLEHIDYPRSVKKVIGECYRILKKDGQIVIGVPNGELAVNSYYNRDQEFYKKAMNTWFSKRNCLESFNTYIDLLNYHFRDQDDDNKYNPHFWAYDFEKLESLLKEHGFSSVKPWKFDSEIANLKREFGSIYVIAVK